MTTTPASTATSTATLDNAAPDKAALANATGAAPRSDQDPRAVFAKAVALAGSVIDAVEADRFGDPTPCAEFDVRSLLGHLVGVLRRVGAIGRGEDPMSVPPVVGDVADDAWPKAWTGAVHEVEAAWSDDGVLTRIVRLPWARLPGAAAMAMYTNEVAVHTWDLATATGQQPMWDEQVLAVAFDAIQQALPAEGRAAIFEAARQAMPADVGPLAPPFAEAVPVPSGAPLIDRLVAWNGRRPAGC